MKHFYSRLVPRIKQAKASPLSYGRNKLVIFSIWQAGTFLFSFLLSGVIFAQENVCEDISSPGSATVDLTLYFGDLNTNWYTDNPPDLINDLVPDPTNVSGVTTGTTFYADDGGGTGNIIGNVSFTVNAIPSAPTASDQGFCNGATVADLVASGIEIQWYSVSSGGSVLNPFDVLSSTTYYASQTVNGCESSRTTVNVTISDASFCLCEDAQGSGTAIVDLTSYFGDGNTQWYLNNPPPDVNDFIADPTNVTASDGSTFHADDGGGTGNIIKSISFTINSIPSPPTAASSQTFCDGATVADLVTTSGTTIQWYLTFTGGTALNQTDVLSSTTYYASETANGCESTRTSVVVTVNSTLPPTASNQNLCSGSTVADLVATGTAINWYAATTGGNALNSATLLVSGTYYASQTISGCESARTPAIITISSPATPSASNDGPACVGENVQLSTPAVSGATYSWTGPGGYTSATQNPILSSVALSDAGDYFVTVTVGSCTSSAGSTTVVVNDPPSTPTASNDGPACVGENVQLSTPAVSGATYSWTGPGGYTSATQNPILSSVALSDAGDYFVTVTVGSCTSSAGSTTVVVNNPPSTPTASNDGPACVGENVQLSTPAVSGATYSWTGPGGYTSATQNPILSSVALSDAGDYFVTVTVGSCTSSAGSTTVVVNNPPSTPTASNDGPACVGENVQLSTPAVSGATYSWTGPGGYTSAAQNPLLSSVALTDAGVYSVTVTVGSCTSSAGSTTVVVNDPPSTPTASNDGPACVGENVQLSTPAVSGATYSWTGPGGYTSAAQNPILSSVALSDAGDYFVTVTVGSCTSSAGSTTVVVNNPPSTPTATNNGPACVGENVQLSTPAVSGATYSWTGPGGYTSAAQNPLLSSVALTDAGVYSVTVTVGSCTSSAGSTTVVVNDPPSTPTASNDGPACVGENVQLSTPAVSGATYSWTGPGGFTSATQNPILSSVALSDAGDYFVTVTVGSCTSSAGSTTVVVNNPPSTPTASNDGPACVGENVQLSTPAVSGATYSWTGPGGYTSATQNPILSSVALSDAGDYFVTVTVGSCTSSAGSTTVVVNNPPSTPTASNDGPACVGENVQLSTPAVSGATYSWTGPGGYTSATQNPILSSVALSDAGDYFVTVTVGSCTSSAGSTTVVVNNPPSTPTATNNGPACVGENVQLSTPAVSGATYSWTGPGGYTSATQNPILSSVALSDAGDYFVTVTVGSCTSSAGSTTVVVNDPPSTPTASNDGPACVGENVQLSTPAVSGATYSWTGPGGYTSAAQNPILSSVALSDAGDYFVTVTVGSCTSSAGSTTVVVNNPPSTPTATNNGPACVGENVQLSTPAVSGATYSWTGPGGYTSAAQNPLLSSVALTDAGVYSVTVTVGSCTSSAGSTTVVVNDPPSTPTASNDGPACVGENVQLSTPAVSGATYSWTGPGGFTSATQNPILSSVALSDAGDYFVTVTVGSCTSSAGSTTVVVNNPPSTPTASNDGPACVGENVQLSTPAVSGATYSWTGPGGYTSAAQNPLLSSVALTDAGVYSVTVTVGSCTSSAGSTTVVVNNPPSTPTASNDGPACVGENVQLSTPAVSGATYSWTGPGGYTSAAQNPLLSSVALTDAGVYSVTVTVGSCTSSAGSTTVVVNDPPSTPTASNDGPACVGENVQLSTPAVSGATYSWTGPGGYTSATQNPILSSVALSDAGDYFVTVTVGSCTSSAGSTTVVVNNPPSTPTASNDGPACVGENVQLSTPAVSGATYSWTGPGGYTSATQNPILSSVALSDAGDYFVTVTVGSCTSSAGSTTVVVNNPPSTPTASNDGPACVGENVQLSTPAVSGATYSWTGPGGYTSAAQNPILSSVALSDAGDYFVTVTVGSCTSSAGSTTVVVNDPPSTPTASNDGPACVGENVQLSTPAVSGATYSWTGPGGYTSAAQNPLLSSVALTDAGVYSVTVTVGSCTSSAGSTTVVVNNPPSTPTASNDGPACVGENVQLSTPAVSGATYSWTGPGGYTSAAQNPLLSSVALTDAGVYSVTVTVGSCTSSAGSTTVVVNDPPSTPTATNNGPACVGENVQLSTPAVSGATYSWTGPGGYTSAAQNPLLSSVALTDAGVYSVTVTVGSCTSSAGSTTVVVNDPPSTPTASNDGPACVGENVQLSTPAVSGATYSWTGPGGYTSAAQNPLLSSVALTDAGVYSVTVTVGSCTSSASTTSVVVNSPPATPSANNNGPACVGENVQLSTPAVSGATYSWTGPGGYTSAAQNPLLSSVALTDAGVYSVTVTVGSCTSSAGSTTVVVNNPPSTPTASNDGPACVGENVQLSTPAVSGATYSWTGPGGYTSAAQNPLLSSVALTDAGVYSVTVTVGSCTSSAGSTTVVVNDPPSTPTASNDGPACVGENVQLSTPAVSGATYSWTGPGGYTSAAQNPLLSSVALTDAGVYSVTVTVGSCTSSASTTSVVVNSPPATPSANNNGPACVGENVQLSTPAVSGATYSWTGPGGYTSAAQNPLLSSVALTDAGVYSVTVTVNGCESSAGSTTAIVYNNPSVPTAGSNSPVSEGSTINLTSASIPNVNYNWTGPNGFSSTIQNPSKANASSADGGTYVVTVTSIVGSCTNASNTLVVINSTPTTSGLPSQTYDEDENVSDIDLNNTFDDPEGQPLTYTIEGISVSGILTASIVGTDDNLLSISLLPNQFGTTSITIRATDSLGAFVEDNLDITVTSVNDIPTFDIQSSHSSVENENTQTISGFAFNIDDGDPDPEPDQTITFFVSQTGATGILEFNQAPAISSTGVLTYRASPNTNGEATFDVFCSDSGSPGKNSTIKSFTIIVSGENGPPTFDLNGNPPTVNEDPGEVTVTAFAFNIDDGDDELNQGLTFNITKTSGILLFDSNPQISTSNGNLAYTPTLNSNGSATFSVTLTDDGTPNRTSSSTSFTISVDPLDDPPTGSDELKSINEDATYTFQGSDFSFSDIDGHIFSGIQIISEETDGELKYNGSDVTINQICTNVTLLNFTPTPDENGSPYATFTFKIQDSSGDLSSDNYTFTINVNSVNDNPTSADASISTDENVTYTFSSADFPFSDVDGHTFNGIRIRKLVSKGSLQYNNVDVVNNQIIANVSNLKYTPIANENGSPYAEFDFQVRDSQGSFSLSNNTMTISVGPVNDRPTGSDESITLLEDESYTFANSDFTFNDIDGHTFAGIQIVTVESRGDLEYNGIDVQPLDICADVTRLVFLPSSNENGTPYASFTFKVRDNSGSFDLSQNDYKMTINVTPVNDPPSFTIINNPPTINEDSGPQSVTNFATAINDGDPELNQVLLFIVSIVDPGDLTFTTNPDINESTGELSYEISNNISGSAIISARLVDNGADNNSSSESQFTITVNNINDPPTLNPIPNPAAIIEDASQQTINLSGITAGLNESQPLSVVASSSNTTLIPNPIVVYTSPNSTGQLRYTPVADINGSATISVTVNDGQASNNMITRTFDVAVTPVNDPPKINPISDPPEILENAGEQVIVISGINPGGGIDEAYPNQTVTITAISNNPSLIASPVTVEYENNSTGLIRFEPLLDQNGTALITVTLDDGQAENNTFNETFTVSVLSVNNTPTLDDIMDPPPIDEDAGPQTMTISGITAGGGEDQMVTIKATSDNQSLIPDDSISIGYNTSETTGTIFYSSSQDQFGTAIITVEINDGADENNTIQKQFTVVIIPEADTPSVSDAIANGENQTLDSLVITRNIVDGPEVSHFKISNILNGLLYQNDGITPIDDDNFITAEEGLVGLRFTPAAENPDSGTFEIQAATGNVDSLLGGEIIIATIFRNQFPVSNGFDSVLVYEDSLITTIDLSEIFDDPDHHDSLLTYSLILNTNQALFDTIIVDDDQLDLLLAENQFGDAQIIIAATDPNQATTQDTLTVHVLPTNDPPNLETSPVTLGNQDIPYVYTIVFSDPENQAITIEPLLIPDWLTFESISSDTAKIFGTPTDAQAEIAHNVSFYAFDSENDTAEFSFDIFVNNENDPPYFTSVKDTLVEVGKFYDYLITAEDPDSDLGDVLTFSVELLDGADVFLNYVDNGNGTATVFGTPPSGSIGTYRIQVTVKDLALDSAVHNYVLNVEKQNILPELQTISITINEDTPHTFSAPEFQDKFFDLDNDTIEYIKIIDTPFFGKLSLDSMDVSAGDTIGVNRISKLVYIPKKDDFSNDIFRWNAFDGGSFALANANCNIFIVPIKDPPELLEFEENSILFEFADVEGAQLTESTVFDGDGDNIQKVTISFVENYTKGQDSIFYDLLVVEELDYIWEDSAGVLTIRGLESTREYTEAIQTLKYVNTNPLAPSIEVRTIEILIYDAADEVSIPYLRQIEFENTFVDLVIPTGITPNEDGVNDTWTIENIDRYDDTRVSVYSRSGQLLFDSYGYVDEWDGTKNGEVLPAGPYYYVINISKFKRNYTGTISILR